MGKTAIDAAAFATDIGALTANQAPNFSNAISQLAAAAIPPGGYTTIDTFDSTTWKFTFASDPSNGGGAVSNLDVNAQEVGDNNQANGQNLLDTISAALWGVADNTMWFLDSAFGIGSANASPSGGPQMPLAAVQLDVTLYNYSSVDDNFITAMIMQESSFKPGNVLDPSDPDSPEGLMQVKPSALKSLQNLYPDQFGGLRQYNFLTLR